MRNELSQSLLLQGFATQNDSCVLMFHLFTGGFELTNISRRMLLSPAVMGIHPTEPTSGDAAVASTAESRKAEAMAYATADDTLVSSSTSTIFRKDQRRWEGHSFDRCAACSSASKDHSNMTSSNDDDDSFKMSAEHFSPRAASYLC